MSMAGMVQEILDLNEKDAKIQKCDECKDEYYFTELVHVGPWQWCPSCTDHNLGVEEDDTRTSE